MAHICQKFIFGAVSMFQFGVGVVQGGSAFCHPEFQVSGMTLDLLPQTGIINGNRRLPGQRIEKVKPFLIALHRCSMEHLYHPHYFSFYDQGDAKITNELFVLEELIVKVSMRVICQVGNLNHAPFQDRFPCIAFTQSNIACMKDVLLEPIAGGVFKGIHDGVEEQDRRGIHA